eukprot:6652183-Pyramimonas_sp.AAC.1
MTCPTKLLPLPGARQKRPALPAARRGASCPVDHPYRGPLLLARPARYRPPGWVHYRHKLSTY